ncbi:hypothetical protein [Kineosporia sp. A_224]|uniref:hypothetical protein n=1 Tax=Kineosporia sp. A_224 TaxID=1962180 RepID=UPI000B4A9C41|nr:hypothetical protein [Kineosporia sp. A_224]
MTDDLPRTRGERPGADPLVALLRALPPDLPDVPDRFERVRAARAGRRRRAVLLAAAAVVAVVGTAGVLVRGAGAPSFLDPGPAAATDASTCPQVYGAGGVDRVDRAGDPWVPGSPSVPDGGDRLVPQAVPQRALLCRYAPADGAEFRAGAPAWAGPALAGSVVLVGPLDTLAGDLTWLPEERLGAPRTCTAIGGPTTRFLLGLTYPDGVVWVAGNEDPNGCDQSWNGRFATGTNLGRQLAATFDAKTWVGGQAWAVDYSAEAGPCWAPRSGRLGQGRDLVPAGATSLRVCRQDFAGTSATWTSVEPADYGRLLALLDDLRTSEWDSSCSMLDPDAPTRTTYELRFDYPAGPPVVVRVDPTCRPAVMSGDREVNDAGPLVPEIERLLAAG